jgi:hypothetical protein
MSAIAFQSTYESKKIIIFHIMHTEGEIETIKVKGYMLY